MLRLICLILVPLAELLLLSFRVDTGALLNKTVWWAAPLGYFPEIASSVFVSAAVFGLVVCARPREETVGEFLDTVRVPPKKWPVSLLVHSLLFLIFAALTLYMVEGDAAISAYPDLWFLYWSIIGFLAAVSWAAAVMPLQQWLQIIRRYWLLVAVAALAGSASWASGLLTETLWKPLREPTFLLARVILQVFGLEVVHDPETYLLGTKTFEVNIAAECSGYEGIGLILVLLGVYFWLFRKYLRFPRAFLLVPLGTVIIWLANAARIAALIMVGTKISPEIALGGFHSRLGSLVFVAVGLGLVATAHHLPFFSRSDAAASHKGPDETTAYLLPFLILVGIAMVTGLFTSGYDWLYPMRVLACGAVIVAYWRKSIALVRFRDIWSLFATGTGVAVFGIWMALERVSGTRGGESAIAVGLAAAPLWWATTWLVFRVLGAVVIVPVAEELAFRGYLLRRLIGPEFESVSPRKFTWFSFLVSSILFGAMHGRWLAGTLAGMLYAGITYRRGRLSDAVVAHGITNALIAAYVLLSRDWSLW